MTLIIMTIFNNALGKLELFYDKLGMPYIQSIKQSMMKLIINEQKICCYSYILQIDYLFITKMFLTFLISIYKSVQNL